MNDHATDDVLAAIDETLDYAGYGDTSADAMRWSTDPDPREKITQVAVSIQADMDRFAAAMQSAGSAFARFYAQLRDAGVLPDVPPKDPRARALWLRQHRNTGPDRTWRTRRR